MTKIASTFVQVGERKVLVRHAGRGPALLLVHQSPQSGAALQPLIEHYAGRCAVFAPDTPGFGQSDPLAMAQPTIPDLAQALGGLLQALGLQRVLLYGVHTGASIAARLAQDQPARVAALVCDGLALFTAQERQPLLDGYLPPFEPSWDGTHLLWLWARVREQTLFFPWQTGTQAARLAMPLATPEKIHADVMALLDAGDGYRAGYRAPLLYTHSRAGAMRLTMPARLLYRDADVLRPHLERHGTLPPNVQARAVADAAALVSAMDEVFAAHAASATSVDAAAAAHAAASPRHVRVPLARGALAFRCLPNEAGAQSPVEFLIPNIGTAAHPPADRPSGSAALALDLPGHGASDPRAEADLTLPVLAADVMQALTELKVERVALRAIGGGCALAAVLAAGLGARCVSLHLTDPLPLSFAERAQLLSSLPDLHPVATGAHLIAAWNWARLSHLFWPWRVPDASAAIAAPAPPPRQVHADAVEMLRAGPCLPALWQAALSADLPALVSALRCPVQITSGEQPELQRLAARLHSP